MLRVACKCGKTLGVTDDFAGKQVRCPACLTVMTVPGAAVEDPPATPHPAPLLPANIGADFVRNRNRVHIGEEHYIVSMFIDMRGSTRLAETRLPFDTVFLINRFLEAASQAVVDSGGQPNQFVGDGLLALFGLDCDPATACRQAIRAAAIVAANVEYMNHELASELQQPVQFGIGIHGGEVIIGTLGYREHATTTAIGEAVHIASRLQDLTKEYDCQLGCRTWSGQRPVSRSMSFPGVRFRCAAFAHPWRSG